MPTNSLNIRIENVVCQAPESVRRHGSLCGRADALGLCGKIVNNADHPDIIGCAFGQEAVEIAMANFSTPGTRFAIDTNGSDTISSIGANGETLVQMKGGKLIINDFGIRARKFLKLSNK